MSFSDYEIQAVWTKGRIVPGYDPSEYRQDACTAWMIRSHYGNRNSLYGWEIDHINPNGGDGLRNLQPLQWENNAAKSDVHLTCVVRSTGNTNASRYV